MTVPSLVVPNIIDNRIVNTKDITRAKIMRVIVVLIFSLTLSIMLLNGNLSKILLIFLKISLNEINDYT